MSTRVCCVLLSLLLATVATPLNNNPGTTEHIKDIFTGRCYDYKEIKYKALLPQVPTECEDLYSKFFTAFGEMAPCDVSMKNYEPYMDAARQDLPQDKAMFWSGVKQLVHEYAADGQRYVTLEDTLIGYVVDGLVWCGQGSQPGVNYTRCPSWTDCPLEASESFWAAASKSFAESARGEVTVMMDGSRADRPAYRRDSFFGKYELPFLHRDLVSGVHVLLVHPLETPAVESCDNGSLALMKEDVTSRGYKFSCVDDPQAILHLLCANDPSDRECRLVSTYMFPGDRDQGKHHYGQPPVLNTKVDRFASIRSVVGFS